MRKSVIVVALMMGVGLASFAANVTIPTYQLLTRGALEGGLFVLRTQADIDIQLGGGYKFGGELSFSIDTDYLERPAIPGEAYDQETITSSLEERLGLSAASVVVRDLFGTPLSLRYFVGERARLLTGDIFPLQFGTQIVASDFRGLLAFPEGVVYDGVHVVDGTGLSLGIPNLAPWVYLEGSVYQDGYLGPGFYSTDVRAAFNTPNFKSEVFLGASIPQATYGAYRGGVLLYYSTGQGGEVLSQIGVTRWAPVSDGAPNIDDFYFLFEPRVHVGIMSIVLTLFWHPEYYVQAPTNERGATDIVVRLIAGDVQENVVSGGLENGIRLRPASEDDQLDLSVAPFVTINSSGVIWDFKANFNVFPFQLDSLFEAYVGIRTSF